MGTRWRSHKILAVLGVLVALATVLAVIIRALDARREGLSDGGALNTAPTPLKSAMVIVEPRQHKHLRYVLHNFDAVMPPHYDLYLFHGASAAAFAGRCVSGITRRRVVLVPLPTDNLTADQYNELFKKQEFWDQVDAENIVVFQTDAVLCAGSPWSIADFEQYGYVGCAYDGVAGPNTHWAPHAFWGVGGLSFRKKSLMTRCIRELAHAPHDPEDVFYSDCLQRFGTPDGPYRVPDPRTLSRFCSQNTFLEPSFGAHRLHDMMDRRQLPRFVEFCPAASPILDA